MPIKDCTTSRGEPAYRYGDSGKPYPYDPTNEESKKEAYNKASKQGRAINWARNNR